jgi:DinB superfamily
MIKEQKDKFPDTYAALGTEFLIGVYEAGAERLQEVIQGLTAEDLRSRPLKDKWTIQEILAHTLDSEIMATLRIRFTIAEPNSKFIVYDQDVWAVKHDYQSLTMQDISIITATFLNLREMNTRLFRLAKTEDWEKVGFHPELGAATLRNLLELYADHLERHLGQILHLRELLQKPIEMPLLLGERLY